ncbi:S1 family peptidase [Streptomyces sp. APSN-46.1]|uniref:S1 family peptidase n=1 Tax=Streptomyces sp. APSN-46.1 TaxID=2929049 RepID=UPI001FB25F8B|nr:S1 family peptidase [Streptomyces sp. APSN-46.1]MCJ1677555.1 S1 family peptidase [Streptomyces sp. APSN-46.1]
MNRSLKTAIGLGTAALALVAGALPASSAPLAHPVLTDAEIAALTPADQAKLLNPLRELANAADSAGRSGEAGIYSGIELDANTHTVTIYLTDPGQKQKFLAAAKKVDPEIDTGLARIKQGKNTRQAMHAARDRLLQARGQLDAGIESVTVPPDGSALHLGVKDVASARRKLASQPDPTRAATFGAAVETVVEPAVGGSDMSRLRDTPAWIAGAALTNTSWTSGYACTSGVPTRRKSDNRSYLITAAHCFSDGNSVYTGWEGGGRNYIGQVTARANLWDAIAVDTTNTGVTAGREWDGPVNNSFTLALTSSAYSYNGDYVCQDGYSSGVVCNIKVVNQDKYWTGSNGVDHRGVEGTQVNGSTAIRGGDSGGLVFSITGSTRQARGINSWGGGSTIRWTEVIDIYNTWGLQLAP